MTKIAVSSGDPAGIGPDICIKAFGNKKDLIYKPIVFGNLDLFEERAAQIKLTGISSKSISNNSASSTSRKIYKKKSDDLKDLEELYNDGTLTKAQFKKAKNKLS